MPRAPISSVQPQKDVLTALEKLQNTQAWSRGPGEKLQIHAHLLNKPNPQILTLKKIQTGELNKRTDSLLEPRVEITAGLTHLSWRVTSDLSISQHQTSETSENELHAPLHTHLC